MATAARKARKRAGVPFTKAQKTPTPPAERAFATEPVLRTRGDLPPAGYSVNKAIGLTFRSPKRVLAFIASGGIRRGSSLSGAVAKRSET